MKNKKIIIPISAVIIILIIVAKLLNPKLEDYQKLGLDISKHDIKYYTVYEDDFEGVCKEYNIQPYDFDNKIGIQLEQSNLWSKEKYYEYVIESFNSMSEIELDREDVYYYYGKGSYAIFDIKNKKLFYFHHLCIKPADDYNDFFEKSIQGYIDKEVYDVKCGWQGDGTDYYVYTFNNETGNKIKKELEKKPKVSTEKLDDKILDNLNYTKEVKDIQKGLYFYQKICRTSDEYKKTHFTDEQATGCEIVIYDIDNNKLYYYWGSI